MVMTIPRLFCVLLVLLLVLAAAGAAPAAATPAEAGQMLALINQIRTEHGLPTVRLEPRLTEAAEAHSRDMARHDVLGHEGSDGSTLEDRMARVGYAFRVVAENVAGGQKTPEQVVEAWMNSPEHRENILRPAVRQIGVGHAQAPGTQYGDYWTLDLAAPLR